MQDYHPFGLKSAPLGRENLKLKSYSENLESIDFGNQPSVVFCNERKRTEEVVEILGKDRCVAYHGRLAPGLRRDIENRFMRNDIQIVGATVAYGLGVDKPDIRLVVRLFRVKCLK